MNNNSLLLFLNGEDNEYILTLPINTDIYGTIQNMIYEMEDNINISNFHNENSDLVEFNIEFEFIDNEPINNNYFKNCNEINEKLCKSTKIKKGDAILNENCFICMEQYNLCELKRELPTCKHYFHKKCIDKWIKKKASCPICRDELIK